MTFALLIASAALYVLVATWAVRDGGAQRLWAAAGAAVVALPAIAIGVGVWFSVPSVPLLVMYMVLLFSPMVLGTALALTPGRVRAAPFGAVVAIAAAGAIAGLALGVVAAVYGFSFVRY